MNYYNEWDKKTAAWLQELINRRLIPDGHIDTRSICDVQPGDLNGYTQHHFFCGVAGWPLALHLAGWPTDRPVWTGSCPCQDYSSAGKGLGAKGERDLWPAWDALIEHHRPDTVFGEQVEAAIRHGWLDRLRADMERKDYAIGAVVLGAHSAGADHIRQRLYWVADAKSQRASAVTTGTREGLYELDGDCTDSGLVNTNGAGPQQGQQAAEAARYGGAAESAGSGLGDADSATQERFRLVSLPVEPQQEARRPSYATPWQGATTIPCADGKSRRVEPSIQLLANGVPARVVRLRGYGNAIVPQCAQAFIEAYMELKG